MTRAEVAMLLSAAAGRDQRTIGEADVMAWHEDIGDLNYADSREALVRHYRNSTDRVMPAHIRRLVKAIREERGRVEAHEARALPGRFEDDAFRDLRISRGLATCAEVLGPILARLAERRQQHADRTDATGEHPTTEEH